MSRFRSNNDKGLARRDGRPMVVKRKGVGVQLIRKGLKKTRKPF